MPRTRPTPRHPELDRARAQIEGGIIARVVSVVDPETGATRLGLVIQSPRTGGLYLADAMADDEGNAGGSLWIYPIPEAAAPPDLVRHPSPCPTLN